MDFPEIEKYQQIEIKFSNSTYTLLTTYWLLQLKLDKPRVQTVPLWKTWIDWVGDGAPRGGG